MSSYSVCCTDGGEPWKDKELMLRMYEEEGYTYAEMADHFGCSDGTVSSWMKKHRADELRERVEVEIPDEYPYRDEKLMRHLYQDKEFSTVEISAILDCSSGAVMKWMDKLGIQTRSRSEGVSIASGGSKPLYYYTMKRRGYEAISTVDENLYIHRLAAVAWYGFDAVVNNHVHHKNEIPWCNTQWNLELLDAGSHMSHHHSPGTIWLDKVRAAELYRTDGASSYDVAPAVGVTPGTVIQWARQVDPDRPAPEGGDVDVGA